MSDDEGVAEHGSVRSLLAGVIVGFVILGGAVVWGFVRQESFNDRQERQDQAIEAGRLAAAERSCNDAAETRQILRAMVRDGGITSGVTSGITTGEALIAVILAGGDPDTETQAAIDAYRAQLLKLLPPALDPALKAIVDTLPDRRWDADAERCVDVPVE